MLKNDVDLGVEREFPREWSWSGVLRKDPCAYCGEAGETVDHIVPKGRGGKTSPSQNGTGSCFHCNNLKAHESMLSFLLRREKIELRFNRRQKAFFSQDQIRAMRRAVA